MANTIFTRLKLDSSDFTRKLNMSSGQAKRFKAQMVGAGKGIMGSFGSLGGVFGALSPKMLGVAGAATAVASAFAHGMQVNKEWETALTSLSNTCKMTQADLGNLKVVAQQLSTETTSSATEIMQAMNTIAAGMPELKDNWQGLGATAKAAATLATASNMSLEDSTSKLVSMFNTFGVSAESAMRYVNALAAAAKAGGGDMKWLSDILDKVGNTAHQTGISFEDMLATLEAVAPRFPNAAEAATKFQQVLNKLQKAGGDLDPRVVGLSRSIENLGKRCTTAKDYMEVLGNRCYDMGMALVETKGDAENFRKEIEGTTEAQDQCAAKMNTVEGQSHRLGSAWDNLTASFSASTGAMASVISFIADVVSALNTLIETTDSAISRLQALSQEKIRSNMDTYMRDDFDIAKKHGMGDAEAWDFAFKEQAKDLNDQLAAVNKSIAERSWYKGDFGSYWRKMMGDPVLTQLEARKRAIQGQISEHNKMRNPYRNAGKTSTSEPVKTGTTKVSKHGHKSGTTGGKSLGRATVTAPGPGDEYADLKKILASLGLSQKEIGTAIYELKQNKSWDEQKRALEQLLPALDPLDPNIKKLNQEIMRLTIATDRAGERKRDEAVAGIATHDAMLGTSSTTAFAFSRGADGGAAYKQGVKGGFAKIEIPEDFAKTLAKANEESMKVQPTTTSIDYAALAQGVTSGLSSIGSLLSEFGLEGAGKTISKISSIIGTVLSVLSAINTILIAIGIRKMLPFAEGGIVGGHSFTGDRILARLNSGEMVLNKKQQHALGEAISAGGAGYPSELHAVVKGEDIFLSTNNYYKRTGRKV